SPPRKTRAARMTTCTSALLEGARAVGREQTVLAVGLAREADAAAVPDELVPELDPAGARDHLHQVLLDLLRRDVAGEREDAEWQQLQREANSNDPYR